VLVVAQFVALTPRSNQLRAVTRVVSTDPAKAQPHPNSMQAALRAPSAHPRQALFEHLLLRL
jgi:hypothetical protein